MHSTTLRLCTPADTGSVDAVRGTGCGAGVPISPRHFWIRRSRPASELRSCVPTGPARCRATDARARPAAATAGGESDASRCPNTHSSMYARARARTCTHPPPQVCTATDDNAVTAGEGRTPNIQQIVYQGFHHLTGVQLVGSQMRAWRHLLTIQRERLEATCNKRRGY